MSYALFKVKQIWHYRFQIGNARIQRSTRERQRTRADAIARKAHDDALTRANGGHPIPTLAELAAEWLAVRAPVVSAAHRRNVDVFVRLHMYDLGGLPISELTTMRIELTRNEHLKTRKPATANHWLRIVKLLVTWAVNREILPRLPWKVAMIPLQKKPRAMLPVASTAQWFEAVDAVTAGDKGVAVCLRLMYALGLRESEAAGARWEWLDWERRTYTPGETKGKEAVPLDLPAWLLDYLKPLRQDEGLIGPRADGRRRPAGFARTAMKKANDVCGTKGVTPHRLRGTFATLLMESGAPLHEVQEAMRHKSPLTTMAYLEKRRGNVARAQQRIAEEVGFGGRKNGEQ